MTLRGTVVGTVVTVASQATGPATTDVVVVGGGTVTTLTVEETGTVTVEVVDVGPQEAQGVGGEVVCLDDITVHDDLVIDAGGEYGDGIEVCDGDVIVHVGDPERPDGVVRCKVAEVEVESVGQTRPEEVDVTHPVGGGELDECDSCVADVIRQDTDGKGEVDPVLVVGGATTYLNAIGGEFANRLWAALDPQVITEALVRSGVRGVGGGVLTCTSELM